MESPHRKTVWTYDPEISISESGPFVCRCLILQTVPRFHIPLIEPDMRN